MIGNVADRDGILISFVAKGLDNDGTRQEDERVQ